MRGYLNNGFILFMVLNYVLGLGQSDFKYQKPDQDILTLADVKPAPTIRINSDATIAVLLNRNAFKSIEDLSAPEMKLAGIRINPLINAPSRSIYYLSFSVLDIKTGKESDVTGLPADARLSNFGWSNSQTKMAFTNTIANGVELWVCDMVSCKATRLTGPILNANISNVYTWCKDDNNILATTLDKDRKPLLDSRFTIPTGPVISENDGQKAQNRTYQDLLKNSTDESNFENISNAQILKVGMDGSVSLFKDQGMYLWISYSPDGEYLLTYEMKKPFSYLVTYDRFPTHIYILDKNGKKVSDIYNIPLTEELPKGFMSVRKGPRNIQWRADKSAELYWVEALDGGDPAQTVEERDAVYTLKAPFNGKPELLLKTKERFAGILWGDDKTAIVNERWWSTRNARISVFNPSDLTSAPKLFNERNEQDNYSDPGNFVTKKNIYRQNVLDLTDDHLHMIGDGFTAEGKFPFIDKYHLTTFSKTRVYQCEEKHQLEHLISAIDVKKGIYLTRLESKSEYPNYFIKNISTGSLDKITDYENPFKVLDGVHKEVIKYKRDDGVDLSATLYLPINYVVGRKEKLPMIMWAYPTEFKDKSSAGQITSSANEFTYPFYGSPLFWLTKGYIVLDDASFPIIGEGKNEPNDSFIPQLVANAKAAIDAVDNLGYVDRSRVAIGGHSYGAFMTANLLTHSDLFAAGIARSGAYNRTLTPFGFQSEERNYWEAPDVYDQMSPFRHADKMKTPLLLIHGEEDNNAGTHTLQSERYFNALKGLGATARLVILPKESHGYSARESIFHMLWEQDQWLEKYVKKKNSNGVRF